jgi:hypothetical protein
MNERKPRKLGDLRAFPPPPAELEDRVVDALKARHLIHSGTRGVAPMKIQYAINAAIAVVATVIGLALGQRFDAPPEQAAEATGHQYVLLLYEDESYQAPAPGKMEERIGEYSQWAQDVAATGKYVTGEKLTDDSLLLLPGGARSDTIPAAEQGVLEGYFVITAGDLEEAASIAESCPHLRYGGAVSVRRLAT